MLLKLILLQTNKQKDTFRPAYVFYPFLHLISEITQIAPTYQISARLTWSMGRSNAI